MLLECFRYTGPLCLSMWALWLWAEKWMHPAHTCIHVNTNVCSRPQHVENHVWRPYRQSCDMNNKFDSSLLMVFNKSNLYSVLSCSYSARPLRKHPLTCFHTLSSMDNGQYGKLPSSFQQSHSDIQFERKGWQTRKAFWTFRHIVWICCFYI